MYLLDSVHEVIVDVWQKWSIKYFSIFLENGKKNIHESSLFALEFDRPSGSILVNLTRKNFLCTFNLFKNTHKVEFFEIYTSFQKIYSFLLSENYILFFYLGNTSAEQTAQRETLFVSYILSGYLYPISPINHWEMLWNAMRHSSLYFCWQNWRKKIKIIYVKRIVLIECISHTFYPSYWRHLYFHEYF